MACDKKLGKNANYLIGDAYGNPANTTWSVKALKFSKSGGPFQWFHRYNRCTGYNKCGNINGLSSDDKCCQNLQNGQKCQESCQKWISLDESALPSDAGFYWKFQSDPETGVPSGCPGFVENWQNGMTYLK